MKTNFKSLTVLILFMWLGVNAQIPPSSNIYGPLKVSANGAPIEIVCEITGDASPAVLYELKNNTSGASIISKGALKYDASTGVVKQTILVSPGPVKGSFNVSLNVTTSGGSCESSKSVTVLDRH